MTPFKVIRKIGKMLRGGAGSREIFLGLFMGVLIGMLPGANFSLLLAILILLLLNANVGFALLGVAVGKIVCLSLSPITFQIGFTLIHNIGLEGLFRTLANTPVIALMGFDNYCQVGGFPLAVIIGILAGFFLSRFITRIREQMLKAKEHAKINKTANNFFVKFLLWLTFGKKKLSTADVLSKHSPFVRKSGIIFVVIVLLISLAMEFLLLDKILRSSITSSISSVTGAEVNIDKAHLSLAGGELTLENIQVTDADQPNQNSVQIATMAADLSMSDLLRKSLSIDLLKGSRMQFNTPRATPGEIYSAEQEQEEPPKSTEEESAEEDVVEDYLAKYEKWKPYIEKAVDYLKERKAKTKQVAKNEPPVADKDKATQRAKQRGYLKTTADNLITDRPAWTIHRIEIEKVIIGNAFAEQQLTATNVSSQPELNGKPTTFSLKPSTDQPDLARIALRFDDTEAPHELAINAQNISLGNGLTASDSFPLDIQSGNADLTTKGTFTVDELALPFSLIVHDLKADAEKGKQILGVDAAMAVKALNSMQTIELNGNLYGSMLSPRIKVDTKKLKENMQGAIKDALKQRANEELDKGVDKAKEKAGDEINKLLEDEDTKKKADKFLKKLF